MSEQSEKKNFWNSPLTSSWCKTDQPAMAEQLIGYFIGPFGALLSSGIFTSYLNYYFTDVLTLSTSFLSVLQLVSTIFIVAANLIVGQLIERTKVLAGKARPWILLSALTLSIASILMFIVPFTGTARYVWIAIAYNLYYSVAYPIYNTANSTLVSCSTRNSQKRGTLASFANIATLGAMGAGSMVFPILVSSVLHKNQTSWFICMLAVAIFAALTIFLQYKFTRERVTEELLEVAAASGAKEEKNTPSIGEQLKAVTGEKWWWMAVLLYLLFQFAGALKNGSMAYFCQNYVDLTLVGGVDNFGVAQTILAAVGAVPMIVAAAFVVPLCNKFGKRQVVFVGMVIGAAGGIIAIIGGKNLIVVAVGVAIKCLGSSPLAYMILAMLSDVIDHIEYKCGIRTDGLTMSIYSSLMVASVPIMNAVMNALLSATNYNSQIVEQAGATEMAIDVCYVWVETIGYALCAVLVLFWNVEKNLPAEQQAIKEREQAQVEGKSEDAPSEQASAE